MKEEDKMERLTKRVYGEIDPPHMLYSQFDEDSWNERCREKLAYYEDLEEIISSIFEGITIEMIVDEIESEHNKSMENILNLCKKLKEMKK